MSYERQQYKGEDTWEETVFKNNVFKRTKVKERSEKAIANGKEKYKYTPEKFAVCDTAESNAFSAIACIKSTSRNQIDDEGIPVWHYRTNTSELVTARESIAPQEMTFGFLSDFSCWDIDRQDTMLSRNCYVIKGALNDEYYSNKLNTVDFEFWVDAQTGVLPKYKCFSASGELVEELKTTSFVADKAIQTSTFSADWYDSMY